MLAPYRLKLTLVQLLDLLYDLQLSRVIGILSDLLGSVGMQLKCRGLDILLLLIKRSLIKQLGGLSAGCLMDQ